MSMKSVQFGEPMPDQITAFRAELERADAVDLVLIHAMACSSVVFPGLVPQDVIDGMAGYVKALMDECGDDLVPMLVAAIRLLANVDTDDEDDTVCNEPPAETDPPPPGVAVSDYEREVAEGRHIPN